MIENISNSLTKSMEADIAFFNGNVMIVWSEWDKSEIMNNIYYSIFDGVMWSDPKVAFKTKVKSEFPQITVDPTGIVHMTWMEGSGSATRDIFYAYFAEGRWSKMERIYHDPLNSCWSRIKVDGKNIPHIVWSNQRISHGDKKRYDIYYNRRNSYWKKMPVNISNNEHIAIHPAFCIKSNNGYCCWMQGTESNWRIYFSEFVSGKWSEPIRISKTKLGWWPSIMADSKGNVHVLFSSLDGIWSVHRINSRWGSPKKIPGSHQRKQFVGIDVDPNDILHAVWVQGFDGHNEIFYTSSDKKFKWTNEIKLISNGEDCGWPVIKFNLGFVHIVWVDGKNVWYRRIKIKQTEPIPEPIPEPEPEPIPEPEPEPEPEPTPEPEITLQCQVCQYISDTKDKCLNPDWKPHDFQSCPYYQKKPEEDKMNIFKTILKTIAKLWTKTTWKGRFWILVSIIVLIIALIIIF